jgi:hypothetical protein
VEPVQEYFFENNIEVWRMTNTGVVIYYNTSDGEYFQDANQRLYKIVNGKKVVVDLSVNSSVFSDNPETLSNYRREQLILKLSYEALVKSRLVVQDLEKSKMYKDYYQEGKKLHWKLAEAREKAEEFSKLYDDLARERVSLVEVEKEG